MGNYVTEAEVRAEGAASASADRINARIEKWEALVDQLTQNCFRVLDPGPLTFDGNNMSTLYFNVPIIEVEALKINGEDVALDEAEFIVYNGRTPMQDDRRNPRIVLSPSGTVSRLFRAVPSIFLKGYDQVIEATWGFVDDGPPVNNNPTYKTPRPIKDAVISLVVLDLDGYFDSAVSSTRVVLNEVTDGHSVTYKDEVRAWSMLPNGIADVLRLYRRPQIISAPDPLVVSDPSVMIWGW